MTSITYDPCGALLIWTRAALATPGLRVDIMLTRKQRRDRGRKGRFSRSGRRGARPSYLALRWTGKQS